MTAGLTENQINHPSYGRIGVTIPEAGITRITIPKEGFSYRGSFTLLIIILWLMMMMVWTILLIQFKASLAWISLPFWLLGLVTLRLSLKVIMSSQEVIVSQKELTLLRKEGSSTAHVTLTNSEIEKIIMVEGAYKALSGITRKGRFPAIIHNAEAFGFGERCTKEEKQFLIDLVRKAAGK